jgi:MFS family permease
MQSNLPTEFWRFIGARLFFVLGLRMITTIIIYQTFKLSSTFMVGMVGLAEFIPSVITALFAGPYIDKHNKKNILAFAYLGYLLCAIGLATISLPVLGLSTNTKLIAIVIITAVTGIARSFAGPAANSMIPAMVVKENLPKAVSYNSSIWLFSSVSGHALGGLLIGAFGIASAYSIAAACVVTAIFFVLQILPKPPVAKTAHETTLQAMRHGFKFVYNNKALLGVISLDLFAVFFGGAVAFVPEVCEKILFASPTQFGFLNAAVDFGCLLSMLLLLKLPLKTNQGLKMLLAVAGFGICIIIFGFSTNYWLSFTALVFAGMFDGISVVVRGVIAQMQTPDELRGRVAAINLIFINSSNELGQFESGLTSRLMGTTRAIVFGGVMSVLVVIATWFVFPKLKKVQY